METQELIELIAARDEEALVLFHRQYRQLILAIARRIVGDEWDAEEVLQDVVWTVWRKAHTLREDTNLKAWVSRVSRNAALMLLRKRKRVPTPIDSTIVESAFAAELHLGATPAPDDTVMSRVALERLQKHLDALDPINRALFFAMDVEGADRDEVAEELGLTISALKSRLHRVRRTVHGVENLVRA